MKVAESCWTPSQIEAEIRHDAAVELQRCVEHLRSNCCASEYSWEPGARTQAAIDAFLASGFSHQDHNTECACATRLAYLYSVTLHSLGHLLTDAAENVAAAVTAERPVALSWESNVRDILEASGQICWALNTPGRTPIERQIRQLQRLYLINLKSETEAKTWMGVGNPAQTRAEALAFGFSFNKKGDTCSTGPFTEKREDDSAVWNRLVDRLELWTSWQKSDMNGTYDTNRRYGMYGMLSGVTHARLYRQIQHWTGDDHLRVYLTIRHLGIACAAVAVALNDILSALGRKPMSGHKATSEHYREFALAALALSKGEAE